jgi:hypothetical protein
MVRWAAVAKDSKLAVNHTKYHFTEACPEGLRIHFFYYF